MSVSPLRPRSVPAQRIAGLAEHLRDARLVGDPDVTVSGITHDSRAVRTGDLYVARPGLTTHGIAHVAEALASGARAVLTDPVSVAAAVEAGAASVVEVGDVTESAGIAAAWVYGDPASNLVVVGITGTNGKTTTSYLVESGLRACGHRTGLIGTIETHIAGEAVPSVRTTPESTDLQALFAVMREHDVTAVAMEVSSHALALGRVSGTRYAVAVFTNLSQDHLDFHADMADYFAAKAMLFTPEHAHRGVVCVDDEWGRRLAEVATIPVTTIGPAPAHWTRAEEEVLRDGGRVVLVDDTGRSHVVETRLPGRFNLQNAAAAYVALLEAGVDEDAARAGLATMAAVPGRMERVDAGQPFLALVDYAHTPEAVATLLAEARGLAGPQGHVVVVLCCGGDRDRAKRPMMGAAAANYADVAVLTNDNPRSEDPDAILAAMAEGARGGSAEVLVLPDRRAALSLAVARAQPGDVVVIAGKGHEQGQEYADRVVPFDDRTVVREALRQHGYAGVA